MSKDKTIKARTTRYDRKNRERGVKKVCVRIPETKEEELKRLAVKWREEHRKNT